MFVLNRTRRNTTIFCMLYWCITEINISVPYFSCMITTILWRTHVVSFLPRLVSEHTSPCPEEQCELPVLYQNGNSMKIRITWISLDTVPLKQTIKEIISLKLKTVFNKPNEHLISSNKVFQSWSGKDALWFCGLTKSVHPWFLYFWIIGWPRSPPNWWARNDSLGFWN